MLGAGGDVALGLGESGGREADNMSCENNDSEDDANEEAADERIDGRRFIEVGEGGGDGFGMEVVILEAGRMSCDLALLEFERLRKRVEPTGIPI
jgi:hypothetical protein